MYYLESDTIAAKWPKWFEAIQQLDDLLASNADKLLTREFVYKFVDESTRTIDFLLTEYVGLGVVTEVDAFACPNHPDVVQKSSAAEDHLYCDLCDQQKEIDKQHVVQGLIALIPPQKMPDNKKTSRPRVFISYSHDSTTHAARVLKLSDTLRALGIDCWIDQYTPNPEDGWPLWMERKLEWANFVLIVCSERYFRRSRGEEAPGIGKGVAWESILIRNELYDQPHFNAKFIPVLLDRNDMRWILPRLAGYTRYTLEDFDLGKSGSFQDLYRHLTGQPETPAPPLGELQVLPSLRNGIIE